MEKRTLMLTDLLNLYFKECMDDINIDSLDLFISMCPKSNYEYDDQRHILKASLNKQSIELSDIKITYSIKKENYVYRPQ